MNMKNVCGDCEIYARIFPNVEKEKIMRKTLPLLFCLLALALMASAQTIRWEIKQHSTDIKSLESQVTAYMNQGYVPMGITYDNKELYILYVQDRGLGAEAWKIEWYDNRQSIKDGISGFLKKGYVPTGITYTGDQLYVLYVKTENNVTGWQLEPSGTSLSSVRKTVQPWADKLYVPSGITFWQDQYWTLLLKTPGTTVKGWLIETYDVGTHGDLINDNIRRGYVPWGLEYSGSKRIDILYVKF
jgi:hypothetical protein